MIKKSSSRAMLFNPDHLSMKDHPHITYKFKQLSNEERLEKSQKYLDQMKQRRSVRSYSSESFPKEIIENIIATAGTAPSGAHKQPWTFCLISNSELKTSIRRMAEKEEHISYNGRMSDQWLKDLAPLGTNASKPFIEEAPYIIVVFKKLYDYTSEGKKLNNYYVNESVGIAVGFLLMAIHNAGLVALTHTPSPMNFLQKILERPANERAFLLMPVGLPDKGALIPNIQRKELDDIMVEYK